MRLHGLPSRIDLVEKLKKALVPYVGEGCADGLAEPGVAVEQPAMLAVHELHEVLWATHNDDEAGRLFEQATLALSLGFFPPCS